MSRARSTIRTGVPMSSTYTAPFTPSAPAWITRLAASGIVMKYRVMSGWVSVTGPPRTDLLLEDRHHAAAAPQHVAETHRDERLIRAA